MVSVVVLDEKSIHIGDTVKLETLHGFTTEGAILSFDEKQKVLVLDTKESATAKPLVRIFNSRHLKSLKVLNDRTEGSTAAAMAKNELFSRNNPSAAKTTERLTKTMHEVKPSVMAAENVSMRGQQAYVQIKRTIGDTRWSGDQIRVLGTVLVGAPYGVDDVVKDATATGFDETRATTTLAQVQKILSKPLTEHKVRVPLDFIAGAVSAH
uniref:AD domain-containing protein n=1 Tax=Caenorhabditis japonica TaxID=281687 RepID=A0A8R1DF68_CAEJA